MSTDKIVVLVGESGCGKTIVTKSLNKRGFNIIKSYTTRRPRYKGEEGHIFVDDIPEDRTDVVSFDKYDGNYYWAYRSQYQNLGLTAYTLEPQGAYKVKDDIHDAEIIIIYLKVDTTERLNRMLGREKDYNLFNPNHEDIYKRVLNRIANDRDAFKVVKADYIIDGHMSIEEITNTIISLIT